MMEGRVDFRKNIEHDSAIDCFAQNEAEKLATFSSKKVTDVLSKNKKQEFDHDDANTIFTNIDKNKIRSWFSTKSNGESNVSVNVVKSMVMSFANILEEGKSTQEIRENAQFVVDIFRGKEKIFHPAKFVEADLKEMEQNIVKMEGYFKNHEGGISYALAA